MRRITQRGIELAHNVNILRTKLMVPDLSEKERGNICSQIEDANFELAQIENRQLSLSKIKTR